MVNIFFQFATNQIFNGSFSRPSSLLGYSVVLTKKFLYYLHTTLLQ